MAADMEFAQVVRQSCSNCRSGELLWSRVGEALSSPAPQEVKDAFLDAAGFFGADVSSPDAPFLAAPVWWCQDCGECGVIFAG